MKGKRKNASLVIPKIFLAVLISIIFILGSTAGYFYKSKIRPQPETSVQKDIYLAFFDETYQIIQENYWEKMTDEQLANLYLSAIEQLTGQPQILKKNDKANLEKLITEINQRLDLEEKKKEFLTQLTDIVLANLKPPARSRLYTQKQEEELANQVKNITEVNQYEILEVGKNANQEEIKAAYQKKEKTAEVERAYRTLSDPDNRQVYDVSGVEPTMKYQLIRPEILHLHLTKLSPTTLDELKRVTEKMDKQESLDTLILDLRDNIGGAVDLLPYFLGPFINKFESFA